MLRNSALVEFNDKILENVSFVTVNSLVAVGEHLIRKQYVDDTIDESA